GRFIGLEDLNHVRRRGVFQKRSGGAEAQRKYREPTEPEGEGERRRADEYVVGGDRENLLGVTIGNDQEIAMKMHGRLRLAGGAGGETQQRDVIAPGL